MEFILLGRTFSKEIWQHVHGERNLETVVMVRRKFWDIWNVNMRTYWQGSLGQVAMFGGHMANVFLRHAKRTLGGHIAKFLLRCVARTFGCIDEEFWRHDVARGHMAKKGSIRQGIRGHIAKTFIEQGNLGVYGRHSHGKKCLGTQFGQRNVLSSLMRFEVHHSKWLT